MTELQRYNLDDRAKEYILSTLWSGRALCDAVGALLSHAAGDAFTLAPPNTPIEQIYEFKLGGLLPINVERAQPEYRATHGNLVAIESLTDAEASLLLDELVRHEQSACVFDEVTPKWSELKSPGPFAFNIGEEIYHIADRKVSIKQIGDLIGFGESFWHRLAVVSSEPLSPPLARENLVHWVKSARLITCTAYDGEGFVAWRRS